jgi:hypothetical protein
MSACEASDRQLAAMLRTLNRREVERRTGLTFAERCTRRVTVREMNRREDQRRRAFDALRSNALSG